MKRFLSSMMASVLMVLTLSCGLTAMASYPVRANGDYTEESIVEIRTTDLSTLSRAISVELDWENIDFVYTYAEKEEWDGTTNTVKTVWDEERSRWSSESGFVKITNDSKIGIQFSVSYDTDGCDAAQYFEVTDSSGWVQPGEFEDVVGIVPKYAPVQNGELDSIFDNGCVKIANITLTITGYAG